MARDHRLGPHVEERGEHEGALVGARVRDREPRLVDRWPAVEDDVEVQRARAVGKVAHAAVAALDVEEPVEQRAAARGGVSTRAQAFTNGGWSA